MGYDKDFEAWYAGYVEKQPFTDSIKPTMYAAWQAARKDNYRIGEKVEIRFSPDDEYEPATICASSRNNNGGYLSYTPSNVRRIPEKSRIDEIAEEATSAYMKEWRTPSDGFLARKLPEIIKSAILKDREEREAER